MSSGAWGAVAAIAIFLISAVFAAGFLTAEFRGIQQWRIEMKGDLLLVMRAVRRIQRHIGMQED